MWPCFSVASAPGSFAKPKVLPTISDSLLQTQTDYRKAVCKALRDYLALHILGKFRYSFIMTLEIPKWPGMTEKSKLREFGLYLGHCVNLDICFSAVSPSWLQVKHHYHDLYLLLPPLLHLSWRRNSLNLGQDWKVCAGWHLFLRKSGAKEEDGQRRGHGRREGCCWSPSWWHETPEESRGPEAKQWEQMLLRKDGHPTWPLSPSFIDPSF